MNLPSFLVMALWLLSPGQVADNAQSGLVTAVHSGDTLTLSIKGELFRARLSDIDAPEPGQPFGPQAQRWVHDLVFDQTVRIEVAGIDVNQTLICRIILQDGRVLNDELLAQGLAWHYRVRPQLLERLVQLEYSAFSHSLGLWLEKDPLPPWEYRRERLIPIAPVSPSQVDYDRILHYGMVGDRKSRKYQWPACRDYRLFRPAEPVTLSNMVEAEHMGYLPAPGCP